MHAIHALKKHWKTTAVLSIIGAAASLWAARGHVRPGALYVTDALFAASMALFCWGLLCLIRNMGMFDSFAYGTKHLIRIFRNSREPSPNKEDGYLEYVRSRPRHAGVSVMMLQAAVLAALSVIVSVMIG